MECKKKTCQKCIKKLNHDATGIKFYSWITCLIMAKVVQLVESRNKTRGGTKFSIGGF